MNRYKIKPAKLSFLKNFTIAALIGLYFLCSCNNQSTGTVEKSDSLIIVDSNKSTDTSKVKKKIIDKIKNEDQKDMDIMNNILKKKKSIK